MNGMGVLSAVELSPGERLRIECEFCSAVGIIKTVRPDAGNARRWHYGVEFLRLYIKHERGGLFSTVA